MTEVADASPRRPRWRDDPLSVFLAIAAILLGGMYLLEQSGRAELDDANQRAHSAAARSLGDAPCTTGAAGARGEVLVVNCPDQTAQTAVATLASGFDVPDFERVVVIGSDQQMSCPSKGSQWAASCVAHERPSGDTVKGAAQR